MTDAPDSSTTLPPPPPEGEAATTTFNQMWEMFFKAEIERRVADGSLPENGVWMGQVLMPPDGDFRVLLNEEVNGVGLMRAQSPVREGQATTIADLAYIEKYDLPDELMDHGHYTIIHKGDSWGIYFNFLKGRAKAADRLLNAGHFLEAARHSVAMGHPGPAVENLFAAAELASKAELILAQSPAGEGKNHKQVASAINLHSRTGNIDYAFVELFNRLGQERPNARYGDTDSRPTAPTNDDLELVAAVIERARYRTTKSTDR